MESKSRSHYDNRKRATLMLRQEIASKPQTIEDLRLKVLMEYGFGLKFVEEFLELHKNAIKYKDGFFEWKA